jgi:hypothetical protein
LRRNNHSEFNFRNGASGSKRQSAKWEPTQTSPDCCTKWTPLCIAWQIAATDGLTEAHNPNGELYGVERLTRVLQDNYEQTPAKIAAACLKDLASFQAGTPGADDLTIMVLRRVR